ncbi:MAG: CheR family methyltransferase [Desulfosarcinaceae bacterium]|nr:CheR family methyltransferase [Desulfosarcinaceae bacterium]
MLSDGDFRQLLTYLDRPWEGYRRVRKGVKKRVRRHMLQLGCQTMTSYLERISSQPAERSACERLMLVTISRFFRDAQLWRHLHQRLIPRLVAENPAPLRFWSAGCACGEEAYSLAMVLASMEECPAVDILATDLQSVCIDRAKSGRFSRSSLKEVPNEWKDRFFEVRRGGRRFSIRHQRLPRIKWQVHNLMDPPPPGAYHLIFLRNNLLTYHRGTALQRALEGILSAMASGGVLIVGTREALPPTSRPLSRDDQFPWVYRV